MKRLELLIDWINNNKIRTLVDIGTDHGKLLINLSKTNPEIKMWGIDIIKSIIKNLNEKYIYKNIKWIHGFGLNPLQDQKIDIVVISGMGTFKILKILKLDSNLQDNFIFQINENLKQIREWIKNKNYFVKKENILENKGYFYHSIFISKTSGVKVKSDNDILFGPLLIKEKSLEFIKYWKKVLDFKKENIIKITNKKRKDIFNKEIEKIKKIL